MKANRLPSKLYGSHSLKAYGYRLGELKGTYGEQENAWDEYSEQMADYCEQDVRVTVKLFEKMLDKGYPWMACELEHQIAWIMARQERNGFCFDKDKAVELYAELAGKRQELEDKLSGLFGTLRIHMGQKVYKRDNPSKGIKAGVPVDIYKDVAFNPNSRQHIARVLMERGWEPTEFTPSGQPKVDESTLEPAKDIEGVKEILEYLLVNKRIAQLAEGDNAWLKLMKEHKDGTFYLHGAVNPNGAVTGRATHSFPNMAQVPAARSPYGKECRSLFRAPEGWYEVGVDACGLELRCLSHYLYKWDSGDYAHEILNGDIHTANQKAAGLATRDLAKSFVYGFMYGAGDAKIGEIVGGTAKEGKELKAKFLKAIPAIANLREGLENELVESSSWQGGTQIVSWRRKKHPWNNGLPSTRCLIGLDGRLLHVRSVHSALNVLLQSAGALVCKKWVVEWHTQMSKKYSHKDFFISAWVHDECQFMCRTKEIADDCVRIAQEAMRETQRFFGFNCQLDTEGKVGRNWFETH
jgi:DNA polymerase I-like protein with 3'-5' exonuclease and polymerase domains